MREKVHYLWVGVWACVCELIKLLLCLTCSGKREKAHYLWVGVRACVHLCVNRVGIMSAFEQNKTNEQTKKQQSEMDWQVVTGTSISSRSIIWAF